MPNPMGRPWGDLTTQPNIPGKQNLHKEETGKFAPNNPGNHAVNVYNPSGVKPAAAPAAQGGGTAGSKTGGSTSGGGSAGAQAGPNTTSGPDAAALLAAFLEAQQRARDEAYRIAEQQQQRDYEYALGQLNSQTDKALQEAYVNKMLSLLRLPQDMAAQGLGGGAAETTLGSLYNNYGNARSQLEAGRQSQLAGLLNTRQNNLAKLSAQRASGAQTALDAYNTQLAKQMASNTPTLLSLSQNAGEGRASLYYRLLRLLGWDEAE